MTALTEIYLDHNDISDISPLSQLTALTEIYLDHNDISDISPLSQLTALTILLLDHNDISDISPLSSLVAMEVLKLHNNQIEDISVLSQFPGLRYVRLNNNQISDISVLANLRAVGGNDRRLLLHDNKITNISALSKFTDLEFLSLKNNQIRNISALSNLKELQVLHLGNNVIEDISPLTQMISPLWQRTVMEKLWISNNPVSDLSPIRNMKNLIFLDAHNCRIQDIRILYKFSKLETIELRGNPLNEEAYSTHLPRLAAIKPDIELHPTNKDRSTSSSKFVPKPVVFSSDERKTAFEYRLGTNNPNEIDMLALTGERHLRYNTPRYKVDLKAAKNLRALRLDGFPLLDFSPILSYKKLTSLYITDCGISDISPLSQMPQLTTLVLENNNISDIAPLAQLPNLEWLMLKNNPLNWKAYSTYLPLINSRYGYMQMDLNPDRNSFFIFLAASLSIPIIGFLCFRNRWKTIRTRNSLDKAHKKTWKWETFYAVIIILHLTLDICYGSSNALTFVLLMPMTPLLSLNLSIFNNPNTYIKLFEAHNVYGILFRLYFFVIALCILSIPIYLFRKTKRIILKIALILVELVLIGWILLCLYFSMLDFGN